MQGRTYKTERAAIARRDKLNRELPNNENTREIVECYTLAMIGFRYAVGVKLKDGRRMIAS